MLHLPPPPRPEYDHGIIRLSDLEMLEIVLQAAQERADVLGIVVRVIGPDREWIARPREIHAYVPPTPAPEVHVGGAS
jgi:hypothetical protein